MVYLTGLGLFSNYQHGDYVLLCTDMPDSKAIPAENLQHLEDSLVQDATVFSARVGVF